ncbi:hypothetical protein A1OE_157 [Candidatus Endolissoclinum faulkneri L2]|uniref:Uncharacterized protein n=1 Tax=Candidatus Endolissoclinum faulkneri L2 TaxID=1193729 RepID=K7ZC74_9PROT|nr:hypothetical protein A1OE_157 [Candidatus Endolissoclinum faulkneri L2]
MALCIKFAYEYAFKIVNIRNTLIIPIEINKYQKIIIFVFKYTR